jgi:hypothetical protein
MYYLKGKAWKKLTIIGFLFKNLNIIVGIANTLWAGLARVPIPIGARHFSLPTTSGRAPGFFWEQGGRSVKLATHPIYCRG